MTSQEKQQIDKLIGSLARIRAEKSSLEDLTNFAMLVAAPHAILACIALEKGQWRAARKLATKALGKAEKCQNNQS